MRSLRHRGQRETSGGGLRAGMKRAALAWNTREQVPQLPLHPVLLCRSIFWLRLLGLRAGLPLALRRRAHLRPSAPAREANVRRCAARGRPAQQLQLVAIEMGRRVNARVPVGAQTRAGAGRRRCVCSPWPVRRLWAPPPMSSRWLCSNTHAGERRAARDAAGGRPAAKAWGEGEGGASAFTAAPCVSHDFAIA